MPEQATSLSWLEELVESYPKGRDGLIPILQGVQSREGYLSEESVEAVAQATGVSINEIYGVATFYTQFRFRPPGEHSICVCQGTACHVRGSGQVLKEFEQRLGIRAGETTADGKFDLETVACVGCCALSPVVVIDGEPNVRMAPAKAQSVIAELQNRETTASIADGE